MGSGAEVTPFVTLTDSVTDRRHSLADHLFTADMALCDPVFTADLPPVILADAGFVALTHAIEAAEALARAVEELRDRVGIPPTFRDAGVDETGFLFALPQLAAYAHADPCARTNPRPVLAPHVEALMRAAYYGTNSAPNRR